MYVYVVWTRKGKRRYIREVMTRAGELLFQHTPYIEKATVCDSPDLFHWMDGHPAPMDVELDSEGYPEQYIPLEYRKGL
jgi:hypothetical protein